MTNREIDALVAEKVMGWTPRGLHPIHECPVFATGTSDTFAPHFSEEIAAAMQVIAAMEARGLWCSIKSPWNPSADGQRVQWYAGFTIHDTTGWNGRADFYVFADTAPLAIALAALKAVGVEVTL